MDDVGAGGEAGQEGGSSEVLQPANEASGARQQEDVEIAEAGPLGEAAIGEELEQSGAEQQNDLDADCRLDSKGGQEPQPDGVHDSSIQKINLTNTPIAEDHRRSEAPDARGSMPEDDGDIGNELQAQERKRKLDQEELEETVLDAGPSEGKGKAKKAKGRAPGGKKGKKGTKKASAATGRVSQLVEASGPRDLVALVPARNGAIPQLSYVHLLEKAPQVNLSNDCLTANSKKGYRMVRASHGVSSGAWYFEITVDLGGETGHTRLGLSTERGDLQAPVGYDTYGYAYRDLEGSAVHAALRQPYGESYGTGDVIGCYINLPDGDKYVPARPLLEYKQQHWHLEQEDPPKPIPGGEILFFKNGVCQGVAFSDIFGGKYYPAASMYTLPEQDKPCTVTFNFGSDWKFPPVLPDNYPPPRAIAELASPVDKPMEAEVLEQPQAAA